MAPGSSEAGPSRAQGPAGGFTLLEVVVVVAVLAVVAGLMVPSLSRTRGQGVVAVSERLVLLVNRARQEATLQSRTWRVQLEPAERRYRFQRREEDEFQEVASGPFGPRQAPAAVRWEELRIDGEPTQGTAVVHLYPTGEQDSFRLTLRGPDNQRTVALDAVGRARIENGG